MDTTWHFGQIPEPLLLLRQLLIKLHELAKSWLKAFSGSLEVGGDEALAGYLVAV